VFLADPKPFLDGTRDIAGTVGETVVKPVTSGIFTLLNIALVGFGVLLLAVVGVMYKHGLPKAEQVKGLSMLLRK